MDPQLNNNRYVQFSKLQKDEKLSRAREMRDKAFVATNEWLEKAIRAYEFKAGHHFTDEEIDYIENVEGREVLVFNKIHAYVELIMGVILQNPVRIYPDPVEASDQFLCDVIEDLVSFVDENQTFAELKHNEAAEDFVITGRGFCAVDIRTDPENPEEIEIQEYVVPVTNVKLPGRFKSDNLDDLPYIVIENWFTVEEFKIRYPNVNEEDINELIGEAGISEMALNETNHVAEDEMNSIMGEYGGTYFNEDKNEILVVQIEYYEHYDRYFGKNPRTGKLEEFDPKNLKNLESQIPDFQYVKVADRKTLWYHFSGDKMLYDDDSPIPFKGYSLYGALGYKDKSTNKTMHYGIVDPLIDPQIEINKRWMQTTNLLNKQGFGIIAELDAFLDADLAQKTWNDPDAITWIKPGGLEKIQEKKNVVFPSAPMNLEQASTDNMREISGVNHDLLGQKKSSSEPGIVVRLRQQQGMVILTRLLESVKNMKRASFRRKAAMIMKYMPDSQIKKILGRGDKYVIQNNHIIDREKKLVAPIRALRDFKYNVRLEDGPGNITRKMADLSILMDMRKAKFPVDPKIIIEKLDISAGDKASWLEFIKKGEKNQAQMNQMKMKLDQQKIMGELKLEQDKIALKMKELEYNMMMKKLELMQKSQQAKLVEDGKERDSDRDMYLELVKLEKDEGDKAQAKRMMIN